MWGGVRAMREGAMRGGSSGQAPWPALAAYLALADELGPDRYMAFVAAEL